MGVNIFLVDVRSKLIFWFTCKERKLLHCYSFSLRKKDNYCYSCITCSLPDCKCYSRGYIFAVWAVGWKVASANNHSIFYCACVKFVTRFARKIDCQVCCQMVPLPTTIQFSIVHAWNSSRDSQEKLIVRSVVKWCKFCKNKKIVTTLICCARLTQDSCNALNWSRMGKTTGFFNLFIHISGWIWMVVGRGYFSHDSSHSENVTSLLPGYLQSFSLLKSNSA